MFTRACVAAAIAIGWTSCASAQVIDPPFISPGVGMFAPQIGTVGTGFVQDVRPVVSHDRKYVTLTLQPRVFQVNSISTFAFQTVPSGFVGGAPIIINPPAAAPVPTGGNRLINPRPVVRPAPAGNILDRQGMTRLPPA